MTSTQASSKGSQTLLYFLNNGMAEPLQGAKTLEEVMHRGQILIFNVDQGGEATEIIDKVYNPDGIDIYDGRIYWTDMGNSHKNDGNVHSAKLDGSDRATLVAPGTVHTAKQCCIDPQTKKLYFTDREGLRVMRVNLDGTEHETIVQNGDWRAEPEKVLDQRNWCVGITVSHRLGKFFWTQKGYPKSGTGRIFSANLHMPEGATPSTRQDIEVVAQDLPECIDLEFDNDRGALYWTDRGELPFGNTLNRKQLVGEIPAAEKQFGYQILAQGFAEAIGLKIDRVKDCIFVADMSGRIWKCDPDRPALKEKVYEGHTSSFTGLALVHVKQLEL